MDEAQLPGERDAYVLAARRLGRGAVLANGDYQASTPQWCIGDDVIRLPTEPSLDTACLVRPRYEWRWLHANGHDALIYLCDIHCAALRQECIDRPGRLPYEIRSLP